MKTLHRRWLPITLAIAVVAGASEVRGVIQPPPPPAPPATAPPATAPPREQPAPPIFRTAVDVVAVDVSVVDDQGRPVRGLTADDFEIEVDGQVRPISSAEFVSQTAADLPEVSPQFSSNEGTGGGRLIMLVVDQGNIRQGAGARFIKAASTLLDNLGPGDKVALATLPGGQLVDFTNHFGLIRARLDRLSGGATRMMGRESVQRIGLNEALAFERNETGLFQAIIDRECWAIRTQEQMDMCVADLRREAERYLEYIRSETATSLTALRELLGRLRRVPQPKTLVLLSEGLVIDRRYSDITWVSAWAASARTSMYAIVLDDTFADIDTSISRASPSMSQDRQLRLEGIKTLVGMARGTSFEVVSGAYSAYERLSRELTGYYLLAFEPEAGERDGKPHQINVKVKRRGIEIRARREFTVSPAANARRADDEALGDALVDPLLATDRRMSVATYSFPDPNSANVRVLVAARLGLPTDERPIRSVAYRILDEDGKLASSRMDDVPAPKDGDHRYLATVVLPAGTYSIKLAGIDHEGKRGTVEHLFTARLTAAGAVTAGDLMLADDEAGARDMRPIIEPVIRAAGLTSYVELTAKDPGVFTGTTVRVEVAVEANAPALATVDAAVGETKFATRRIGEGRVPLTDLPPGPYVVRAVIMRDGRPVGRLLREFRYNPSSTTLSAAGLSLGPAFDTFDRSQVLAPTVIEYFLKRLESTASAELPSPAVQSALAAAREGRLTALPDLVGASDSGGAASFLRGLGLYARGELEPAAIEFRKSMAGGGDDFIPGTFFLGACYAAGGRDSQAVGAWQTTLAAEAPSPAVFAVATDAYLRLESWDEAAVSADEGLAADPGNEVLRLRLATAFGQAGRYGEALAALDGYLERHPGETDVLFQAMRLLYRAHVSATVVEGAGPDRARFDKYLRAYVAAGGPKRALAEQWGRVYAPDNR